MSKTKKTKKEKGLIEESVMERWGVLSGNKLSKDRIKTLKEACMDDDLDEDLNLYEMEDEEDELDMEDEAPVDDLAPEGEDELDMEDEAPALEGGDESMVQDIVSAIADALEAETGVPVSVEGGAGEELEVADDDLEDLGGEEDSSPEVDDLEMGDESEEELDDLEEDAGADWKGQDQKLSKAKEQKPKAMYEGITDEMVAKVAKRVAKRLLQERKSSSLKKIAEAVSDKQAAFLKKKYKLNRLPTKVVINGEEYPIEDLGDGGDEILVYYTNKEGDFVWSPMDLVKTR